MASSAPMYMKKHWRCFRAGLGRTFGGGGGNKKQNVWLFLHSIIICFCICLIICKHSSFIGSHLHNFVSTVGIYTSFTAVLNRLVTWIQTFVHTNDRNYYIATIDQYWCCIFVLIDQDYLVCKLFTSSAMSNTYGIKDT